MSENPFEKMGQAVAELAEIVAILRAPAGCPWDAEQTLETVMPYLIEETYEAVDALASGNMQELREELGDVLLQVVFQAEIAREKQHFDFTQIADELAKKLIRRHPHLFSKNITSFTDMSPAVRWEALKAAERPEGKSRLSGIPKAMPALQKTIRVLERAEGLNLQGPDFAQSVDQIRQGCERLGAHQAHDLGSEGSSENEIGRLLLHLVNAARLLKVEPESALRNALRGLETRFCTIEGDLLAKKDSSARTPLDAPPVLWE